MLEIVAAANLMTFQDAGRFGYQCYGLTSSGPMDWIAHHTANLLVGNSMNGPCIELGLSSARVIVHDAMLIAITGCGYKVVLDGKFELPLWTASWVPAGSVLDFNKETEGNWAYISVNGVFNIEKQMGSFSTNLRAGLGKKIQTGDCILVGGSENAYSLAGSTLHKDVIPHYSNQKQIRIITTPHFDLVSSLDLNEFMSSEYVVTVNSDRMGYRLSGYPIKVTNSGNLLSQGMVLGAVQVPPDGQPIVMMADHPTTGGYPQIAVVEKVDLPYLAQLKLGFGKVQFVQGNIRQSQQDLRHLMSTIQMSIIKPDEDWMWL